MKVLLKCIPLLFIGFALAQTPPDQGKMKKEKMIERLTENLDLSNDQVEAIKKIDQSFEAEEKQIEDQIKALRDQKKEIMKAKKAEIDKVLTDDQKAKLNEMKKERRAKRRAEGSRESRD